MRYALRRALDEVVENALISVCSSSIRGLIDAPLRSSFSASDEVVRVRYASCGEERADLERSGRRSSCVSTRRTWLVFISMYPHTKVSRNNVLGNYRHRDWLDMVLLR